MAMESDRPQPHPRGSFRIDGIIMRNAKRASQTEILDYPERLRRECKKGPAMPIPSLWTRRRAGTGGRSDILEGQRHHRCRKVGIGLDHDDLAMASLDRAGVEIGRAPVCTPVTTAPLVCRLLLK